MQAISGYLSRTSLKLTQELRFKAFGGDGSHGGNSTGPGKKGGDGRN